mmetsp:Transcript_37700/g.95321  ORF Transcript_37700/g.95321 Transcript_37700/m.95321 type:complete len:243 (-) Transcript_37700:751-1479(-)
MSAFIWLNDLARGADSSMKSLMLHSWLAALPLPGLSRPPASIPAAATAAAAPCARRVTIRDPLPAPAPAPDAPAVLAYPADSHPGRSLLLGDLAGGGPAGGTGPTAGVVPELRLLPPRPPDLEKLGLDRPVGLIRLPDSVRAVPDRRAADPEALTLLGPRGGAASCSGGSARLAPMGECVPEPALELEWMSGSLCELPERGEAIWLSVLAPVVRCSAPAPPLQDSPDTSMSRAMMPSCRGRL